MKRRRSDHLAGIAIVLIGVWMLLWNLNVPFVAEIWKFWPVVLIALGATKAIESRAPDGRVWGGLLAVAGGLLLANNLGVIHAGWNIFWPLLLIGFGCSLLTKGLWGARCGPGTGKPTSSTLAEWAVFGGGKRRPEEFEGGELTAVFGGFEIDLRRSVMIGDEVVLNATAVFGGIEIRVPENWKVTMQGTGVFGGYEDKTQHTPIAGVTPKMLTVRGAAVFGGVVVEN